MWLFNQLRKRVTGASELEARHRAFAEAENIIDHLLDEVGWENVNGSSLAYSVKRTAASVGAWTSRNVLKFLEDGYVHRGVNLHTDFVFGRGIDVPKCKSDRIQNEVVNPFWWSPVNQRNFFSFQAQQRRHKEVMLSGELNILVKIDEQKNRLKLYPINPADVLEVIPDTEEQTRPAYYLVRHKSKTWDFTRNEWAQGSGEDKKVLHRSLRYKLFEATPDEMRRGLMFHVGLNEFFDTLRGSSLVQSIYESADEARSMADDGAALCHANAEVGWKTKFLKGGKNIKDKFLEYFRTKTDGSNPSRTPASEWAENDALNRDWVTQRDTGANYRKEDIRAQKLYVFAGLGFGEHYMGDASTGNLATATAMELPVLKMIQAEQKWWESVYGEMVDFAIDIAAVGGLISGEVQDAEELEVKTDEDRTFRIVFPPIILKQLQEYINALKTSLDSGLIPEKEAARLAMEVFEVQEIDEALDELFEQKEIDDTLAAMKTSSASETKSTIPETKPPAGETKPPQKETVESIDPLVALFRSLKPTALVDALKNFRGSNGNGNGKDKLYTQVLK